MSVTGILWSIWTLFLIFWIRTVRSDAARSNLRNLNLVKNILSSESSVYEGDTVELECRVDSRLPERAELAWVKLEGLGEVHYLAVRRSEDGVMDYEEQLSSALDTEEGTGELVWRLTIERISREMAGFYQCEVLLNEEPVSSRQVLVSVRESEEEPDPDNTVFMVARRGTNVTLNCSDLGETGEEVTWSRQGEQMGGTSHQLPLIHVDKSHSGVYTCTVRGAEKLMHVSLLVSHQPHVSAPHYHVSQLAGTSVQLDCEVSAVPVPSVSWDYQDVSDKVTHIQSGDSRSITIQDYEDGKIISSLNIRNLTYGDFGTYTCYAENTEGKGSVNIELVRQTTATSSSIIVLQSFVLSTIFLNLCL